MNATAVTMGDCIMRCVVYNNENGAGACKAVTWNYLYPQGQENSYCWLKDHVGDLGDFTDREMAVLMV
jgi:hypothetical protein